MQIVMIPTEKIYSHPNNPRTDNGDLTELVESIKVMGILQNLTLVPYDPATHIGVNVNGDGSDCYIAVAGNRRLAAAKKAKLSEVPAVISNMDFKAQNRVMLVENLQRETLTPYQQGKTIQLMLSLGDSVADIAKQTGFSEPTVRKRAALAVFDETQMAAVEGRNASMKDYLDLAKIEDEELRNECLKSIGTVNFRNDLARARSTLRDRKNKADQLAVVQSFAQETTSSNVPNLVRCSTIYPSEPADKIKVPDDKDAVAYFYITMGYSIELYREKTAADTAEAIAQQQKKDQIKFQMEQIKEATERTAQLRQDFLEQVSEAKVHQHFGEIVAAYTTQMLALIAKGYTSIPFNHKLLHQIAGIALTDAEKVDPAYLASAAKNAGEWTMFAFICAALDSGKFFDDVWVYDGIGAYAPRYKENSALNALYDILEVLGYPLSDEERQLRDGTHPMFYVEPGKNKKK